MVNINIVLQKLILGDMGSQAIFIVKYGGQYWLPCLKNVSRCLIMESNETAGNGGKGIGCDYNLISSQQRNSLLLTRAGL